MPRVIANNDSRLVRASQAISSVDFGLSKVEIAFYFVNIKLVKSNLVPETENNRIRVKEL